LRLIVSFKPDLIKQEEAELGFDPPPLIRTRHARWFFLFFWHRRFLTFFFRAQRNDASFSLLSDVIRSFADLSSSLFRRQAFRDPFLIGTNPYSSVSTLPERHFPT